jgi:hypothetical protein
MGAGVLNVRDELISKVKDLKEEKEAGRDEAPIEPWERRSDESAKAFAAFVAYRDLGSGRTHDKAREFLGKKSGYDRLLERWSSRFDWVERTNAFDSYMDAKKRGSLEVETAEAAKKHVEAAGAVLEQALKRLKSLDPDDIYAKDLPNWISTAIKLQRQALGMDTLKVDLPGGEELKIIFESVGGREDMDEHDQGQKHSDIRKIPDGKEEIAWEELRATILKALEDFPEAKRKALQMLEDARQ